jgi:predicted nucleotidyltransferase
MAPAGKLDPQTERAASAFLARVAQHHELAGAILFGSRARRTHRPDSDADIAVVLRGPRGDFLHTKLALADIAFDVLLDTAVLVQPLPLWEEELAHPERYRNPALLESIRREGIPL